MKSMPYGRGSRLLLAGHASLRIEVRHLCYVIAAAQAGSFRGAATTLNVEQSAISRRIRDLEDRLGVSLFVRGHSGVCLTNAGQSFVGRARGALNHIRHAASDAASGGRGEVGGIRVGIFTSLASGFLADLLRTYGQRHSAVRLDLVEGAPAAHLSAVRRLQIDIAFLTGTPTADDCDREHLWTERIFVVLPVAHELAGRRKLTWNDLRAYRFIVSECDPGPEIEDYLVKHLAELGHHPSVERHAVGRDNLMHLVAMSQGLTLTSEATTADRFPGIAYRPLSGHLLPFCAIWSRQNDNPALTRLLSLAKAMSRQQPDASGRTGKADGERRQVKAGAAAIPGCGEPSQMPDQSP